MKPPNAHLALVEQSKLCRYNFPFDQIWQGNRYSIKPVTPVIKEEAAEMVVITVYTFFF